MNYFMVHVSRGVVTLMTAVVVLVFVFGGGFGFATLANADRGGHGGHDQDHHGDNDEDEDDGYHDHHGHHDHDYDDEDEEEDESEPEIPPTPPVPPVVEPVVEPTPPVETEEEVHTTTDTTPTVVESPAPAPLSGGNGPIVGTFGINNAIVPTAGGLVLGDSTSSDIEAACNDSYLADYLGVNRANDSDQVKKLQTFLNKHQNAGLVVDGVFGQSTLQAVKDFQLANWEEVLKPWSKFGHNDHTPTGFVYKTTKRWINHLECVSATIPEPQLP